jgi:glycosyltransferase involved in cell wall biosynthesis
MTKLTILIATMDESIGQLAPKITRLPSYIDIVICHQITDLSIDANKLKEDIESIRSNIKIIQRYEKGLSKSRNCALDHVKEGICLISDDDVEFSSALYENITHAYQTYPDADIITFQIETPEGEPFKQYSSKSYLHTKKTLMRVASIEITFHADKIHKSGIRFDEDFGLGSTYPTGEETIFLCDAIDRNLNIQYIPVPIVIHPKEHSNASYSIALFKAKGAVFVRIFGLITGCIIVFLFALKKYNDFQKEFSFSTSCMTMLKAGIAYYNKHTKLSQEIK